MKVLVTGGNGYIGSHCVIALMDAGYDVITFDNLNTGHSVMSDIFNGIKSKGEFLGTVKGDLGKISDIDSVFEGQEIDSVVHFAALSQVAESMKKPDLYYRNNVCGTLNLLDSMLSHDVNKVVFSSTAATYGEPEYTPIDENHPQVPINPYGRSKLMIERIMDDYDMAYGLRSVRLRYFNVAGADRYCRVGEWHDPETHLIPNILKSTFGDGRTFEMYGDDYPTKDGTCIRDYVNVEDLAGAHVLALRYLLEGGSTDYFNIGTNDGNTVKEVFSECESITGKKIPLKVMPRRPGDPAVLVADNSKAKMVLGWEPGCSLKDSIETAYAWEKKMHEVIISQH